MGVMKPKVINQERGGLQSEFNQTAGKFPCLKVEIALSGEMKGHPIDMKFSASDYQGSVMVEGTPLQNLQSKPSYHELALKAVSSISKDLKAFLSSSSLNMKDEDISSRPKLLPDTSFHDDLYADGSFIDPYTYAFEDKSNSKLGNTNLSEFLNRQPSSPNFKTPTKARRSNQRAIRMVDPERLKQELFKNLGKDLGRSHLSSQSIDKCHLHVRETQKNSLRDAKIKPLTPKKLQKQSNSILTISEDSDHAAARNIFARYAADNAGQEHYMCLNDQSLSIGFNLHSPILGNHAHPENTDIKEDEVDHMINSITGKIGDLEQLIQVCNNSHEKEYPTSALALSDLNSNYITLSGHCKANAPTNNMTAIERLHCLEIELKDSTLRKTQDTRNGDQAHSRPELMANKENYHQQRHFITMSHSSGSFQSSNFHLSGSQEAKDPQDLFRRLEKLNNYESDASYENVMSDLKAAQRKLAAATTALKSTGR
jgi:hypothetical protein